MSGKGNCFEVAGNAVMLGTNNSAALALLKAAAVDRDGLTVVHGMVRHPRSGRMHPHAWVEFRDSHGVRMAADFSNGVEVIIPAEHYRDLGKAAEVHEYNWHEALTNMVNTGHYGPWK